MKKRMVSVKLLVNTAYQGPRKEGDVVLVPEDFAARWAKNGIAVYANEPAVEEPVVDEEPVEAPTEEPETDVDADVDTEVETGEEQSDEVDYSNMKAKELYDLCVERGIEVEAKKSKEYYIEKLNG